MREEERFLEGVVLRALERGGDACRSSAGAHGNAARNALRHGDDVGNNAEMLEGECVRAATEHAALNLVEHHKRTMLLGEATNRLKELGSARVHTALALNGLQKDRLLLHREPR